MTVSVILKCCGCLKSFSESLAFTSSPFPSVFLTYWAKVLVFGSVILVYPLVATVSPWLIFSCFKSVKHHFLREASLSCPRPHSPVRTWQHWAFFFIEHIPICLFSVFPLNSQLPENRSCVCFVPDCIPSAEQCLAGGGAPVCLCGRMLQGDTCFVSCSCDIQGERVSTMQMQRVTYHGWPQQLGQKNLRIRATSYLFVYCGWGFEGT